ncbi:MAG: 2-succinyl-6-hydroxy-2,4-cyclohexadiene-1-carboxylate synthase [candidate division Zixibacteria bacterium]|nr:2-succinyl-6-hydroxy-2,4-cyclohexadiene-1-carboxylate synthase [candidate division Zixibacteria bacterium]
MTAIVTTGHCHWNVIDRGDNGRPVIVLLHGFTGCAAVWEEVIDQLRDEYRCIAVDLPGHGDTRCSDNVDAFQLPVVADQLAALMNELHIAPAILWGYSMGGRLALQYAVRHPHTLTHLVLESASPGIADESQRAERRRSDDALANRIQEIGVEKFTDEWDANPIFAGHRRLPVEKRSRMRTLRLRNTADGLGLSLWGMGTGAQPPLHDQLPTVSIPTLVMVGEEDRKFTEIGLSMSAVLPNARFRIIANTGHSAYWEQPVATVACVRDFLGDTAY